MRHSIPATGLLALSIAGPFSFAALSASSTAQAPFAYVVVTEMAPRGTHNGMLFVDLETGTYTRTRVRSGNDPMGSHFMVALHPTDPRTIFAFAGFGIAGTPIQEFQMEGNRIVGHGSATNPAFHTNPGRMHASTLMPGHVLYTSQLRNVGLWARSTSDGKETLISPIVNPWAIASAGGKLYVSTYTGGAKTSKLFEVDPKTRQTREVRLSVAGGSVPPFQAMANGNPNSLLVGDDNGILWSVNPTTGVMTRMSLGQSQGQGAIVAVATHPSKVAVIATANGVWDWVGFYTNKKPIYAAAGKNLITDLDVSRHDQGAVLYYGQQCPGSNIEFPYVAFGGYPSQGNSKFSFGVAGARSNSPALGLIGLSRDSHNGAPLPLDLGNLGMRNCALHTSILVTLNLNTDGQGGVSLPAPIPTNPTLSGVHVTAQFAIADPGANAAGISTTEGVEFVIR